MDPSDKGDKMLLVSADKERIAYGVFGTDTSVSSFSGLEGYRYSCISLSICFACSFILLLTLVTTGVHRSLLFVSTALTRVALT